MAKFMFDTNIFGKILKKNKVPDLLGKSKHQYFVNHIQHDELMATRNEQKRESLLDTFETITHEQIPTESAVWDVSRWDLAKWSDNKLYSQILKELEKKKPEDKGNVKDALVGETAIRKAIILVTDDKVLREAVRKLGGQAIDFETFAGSLKENAS